MEHEMNSQILQTDMAAGEPMVLLSLLTHIHAEEDRMEARMSREVDLWYRALTACQLGCVFVRFGFVREDALVEVAGASIVRCCRRCRTVLDNCQDDFAPSGSV